MICPWSSMRTGLQKPKLQDAVRDLPDLLLRVRSGIPRVRPERFDRERLNLQVDIPFLTIYRVLAEIVIPPKVLPTLTQLSEVDSRSLRNQ